MKNTRASSPAYISPTLRTAQASVAATASIVTFLSVAERGLGFLYRIVLSRLIGAEGLGLYQVALSVFAVFLTIGTGGLPTCVSRLIAKSKAENNPLGARQAVSSGLTISLLCTLPVCVFLGLFAENLPFLFSDTRCIPLFKLLLCGLTFSSLYAVLRGNFWGHKRFLLPSVLELAEEIVMVISGVLLLQNVQGATDGATKAVYAVVISYLFSFTAASVGFFITKGKLSSPRPMLKPLFLSSAPITAVRASGSLINSAIAVLLPVMLIRAGFTPSDALKAFGVVSGMAMPVLMIPATVIGSLALVLVPRLSEDFYAKNTQRLYSNIRRGLSVAFFIACFLSPLFFVLGKDLGLIAFGNTQAGELIQAGCPLLIPLSLTMISTSTLNSMGFEKQTFFFFFISAAVQLVCILFLPSVCGVYAYLIGLGASYTVNAVCNIVFISRQCPSLFHSSTPILKSKAFHAVCASIFTGVFGYLLAPVCRTYLGEWLSPVCIGACMLTIAILLYTMCGIFSWRGAIDAFLRRKQKSK